MNHKYSPNWYWGKAQCQIIRLPSDIVACNPFGLRLILDKDNKFVCFKAGHEQEVYLAIKILREDRNK